MTSDLLLAAVYAAAANAGLLKRCVWQPSSGGPIHDVLVGFSAADTTLFDGLGAAGDTQITYPADRLPGLTANEIVVVDGASYQVTSVVPHGDGSERRARLALL